MENRQPWTLKQKKPRAGEARDVEKGMPSDGKGRRMGPTYTEMAVQKALGVYFARPYSLAVCPDGPRLLRSVLLAVLAAAGVAGLFFKQGAFHLPYGGNVSAPVFSTVVLIWGVGIFLFGFVRALWVWPVSAALFALWESLHNLLAGAWGRSPALFAALLVFLFALLAGAIRWLSKRFVVSVGATFWQFERDGVLCAADLPLGELPPVEGWAYFLHCDVPMAVENNSDITALLKESVFFFALHRIIFCGYRLDAPGRRLTLYLYADNVERAKRVLSRLLRRQRLPGASVESEKDPGWERFRADVYPDEKEYQQIHNRSLYEEMEAEGFDFSQTVSQVFAFCFEESEDARAFAGEAVSLGYDKARCVDRQEPGGMEEAPAFAHEVFAQLSGHAGLARMDWNTGRAVDQAHRFHGHFCEWEIGQLDPEPAGESARF